MGKHWYLLLFANGRHIGEEDTYMLGNLSHGSEHALVDSFIVFLAIRPEDLSLHTSPHHPEGVSQYIADETTEAG